MSEIRGHLRKHEYANRRTGAQSTMLSRLMLDALKPLPPHVLWVIEGDNDPMPHQPDKNRFYKMRSGRLPKALAGSEPGDAVTISATVDPWPNGLGGYISNVRILEREGVQ